MSTVLGKRTRIIATNSKPIKKRKLKESKELINLNDLRKNVAVMNITNAKVSPDPSIFTTCFFVNIETHLLNLIAKSDAVIGAIAWMTSKSILKSLIDFKKPCLFVLQDESYLHLKKPKRTTWKSQLSSQYRQLIPLVLQSAPSIQGKTAIRFIGQPSLKKKRSQHLPLMHDKFLLFGRRNQGVYEWTGIWTGSFNVTATAKRSFENAIYTEQKSIVEEYWKEYMTLLQLSKSIN